MKKSFKKICGAGFMVFLLLCLMASPASAEEKRVIRVAFPEQEGFSTTDASGKHSGYTYDFLQEIAEYTGWEYEFITRDSSDETLMELMEELENGEIDIMGGMLYSDELAEIYDFPEYNCGYSYSTLSVLKDNSDINESNYSTFNHMKVGVRKTATRRVQALEEFCRANGITISMIEYDSDEAMQEALETRAVDALLGSDVILGNNERIIARFDGRPYYFAVTKGNTEVVSGINTAISAINIKDPNYATDLYMKYFNTSEQRITLESFVKANPIESIFAALAIGLGLTAVVGLTMYIRMQRNQEVLLNYERYRILSEMSNEMIFEYNYREDSLMVSERYATYFGGKSRNEHFTANYFKKGTEDIESTHYFAEMIKRRPPDQARYEAEYKTRLASGNDEWVRGTSVIIYDKHNQPLRAVGKIVNINAEKCEKEELINQAHRDSLTGLYNRTSFERFVSEYLEARGDEEGVMMVIDLDHFKLVNDTLGHQGGDEVLEDLAKEMSACFGESAILGRLGGDEFLAFIKDVSGDREAPVRLAESLCMAMNRCYERGGRQTEVSVSIGLVFSEEGSVFEKLYEKADQALYYIKAHGKNSVKIYDASVKDALGNNEIEKRKGAF